jgi:hypothetical protein
VKSSSHIASSFLLGFLFLQASCASTTEERIEEKMSGPISFPFASTSALGDSEKKEPFIIRSNTGSAEYEVQLPGAGRNYEVEIPVSFEASGKKGLEKSLSKESSPVSSDKELLSELPDMEIRQGATSAMLDRSMGVGKTDREQGPSYTLGLAKVRSFYRSKDFEFALIEVNNLLAFYPGSPLLYKMKGSILMKLGHKNLASKSWTKALELTPQDSTLQVALARLKKGMEANQTSGVMGVTNPSSASPIPMADQIPTPIPASSSQPPASVLGAPEQEPSPAH